MTAPHGKSVPAPCVRAFVERSERGVCKAGGQDERDLPQGIAGPAQIEGLLEGCERLCSALVVHPLDVAGIHVERLCRDRRHLPTFPVAPRGFQQLSLVETWQDAMQALAVLRNERVQVDKGADAIGEAIRNPGDHAPAVGVAAQNDAGQVLPPDQVDHVLDVRVQIDLGR